MIFNLNVIAEIPAEWIKLKSEVTKIENGNPIKISVSGLADKYEADFCIVTLSLGVLKATANTLFEPKLPDRKNDAIKALGKTLPLFLQKILIPGSPGNFGQFFYEFSRSPNSWAVVVAHLVERSIRTQEDPCSNPANSKFLFTIVHS